MARTPTRRSRDPARGAVAQNHHAFSPDGRYLAIYIDGGFGLLDRVTGKKLRHWVFPENPGPVAFAPDSRHLAIGVATGVIYLLRLEEAKK